MVGPAVGQCSCVIAHGGAPHVCSNVVISFPFGSRCPFLMAWPNVFMLGVSLIEAAGPASSSDSNSNIRESIVCDLVRREMLNLKRRLISRSLDRSISRSGQSESSAFASDRRPLQMTEAP